MFIWQSINNIHAIFTCDHQQLMIYCFCAIDSISSNSELHALYFMYATDIMAFISLWYLVGWSNVRWVGRAECPNRIERLFKKEVFFLMAKNTCDLVLSFSTTPHLCGRVFFSYCCLQFAKYWATFFWIGSLVWLK